MYEIPFFLIPIRKKLWEPPQIRRVILGKIHKEATYYISIDSCTFATKMYPKH